MSQGGLVNGSVPITEGRMVRTDRYKYCIFAHGEQRESLVDLEKDPGEMHDLARDPAYRDILLAHRERLRSFGVETNDPLVATMLADEVKARPFAIVAQPRRAGG